MIRLTTDQIRRLHELMILETGGATGVRDTDLIELGVGIAENRINPKQIRSWILRHRIDY